MHSFIIKKVTLPLWYQLKGFPVKERLRTFQAGQWRTPEAIEAEQFRKLKTLLRYCRDAVPFYTSLFNELQFDPEDLKCLDDFKQLPVLTKETMKDNFEQLKALEFKDGFAVRHTNGSTASPLQSHVSFRAIGNQLAAKDFGRSWWGVSPGDRYISVLGKLQPQTPLRRRLVDTYVHNNQVLSRFNLSKQTVENYYHRIRRFNPRFIYGWADSLYALACLIQEYGFDCESLKIKAVFSTSEMLHDYMRKTIAEVFHCPVVNEYGCAEVGTIAFECPHGGMHLMSDYLYTEMVAAASCEKSNDLKQIVVTDLDNWAMPLLRYKTGDVGRFRKKTCACGRGLPVMDLKVGREQDMIVLGNQDYIHSAIVAFMADEALKTYGQKIKRFQTIQHTLKEFQLNLVVEDGFEETAGEFFCDQFRQHIGRDVKLNIQFMDQIPVEPSGKFRECISKVSLPVRKDGVR